MKMKTIKNKNDSSMSMFL